MKKYTISACGQEYSVWFSVNNTVKGLDVSLWCDDGPYASLNPGIKATAPNRMFVKNYSENEGMDKWLEDIGVAKPTGRYFQSGCVNIPEYEFSEEFLRENMAG